MLRDYRTPFAGHYISASLPFLMFRVWLIGWRYRYRHEVLLVFVVCLCLCIVGVKFLLNIIQTYGKFVVDKTMVNII